MDSKINTLIANGRKEIISKKEMLKYPIGSYVSYENVNNIFKQAGFITEICDDYFIYVAPDFKQRKKVYFDFVKRMWVGKVNKVSRDILGLVESKQVPTWYPVYVGNVIVYYARAESDYHRYKRTDKCKRQEAWVEYFNEPF